MRFLPAGHHGLLVECADLSEVMALDSALRSDLPAGVQDLVPAARTVLLTFAAGTTHAKWVAEVTRIAHEAGVAHGARIERGAGVDQAAWEEGVHQVIGSELSELTLRVDYDGADLAQVGALTGMTTDEVVQAHLAAVYVVAFVGFSPGFGYLSGGDPRLWVPRRPSPRTRVPAGSVALAGEFTGIYPRSGPGGWQLIGHTDASLWDLQRAQPALLTPGTRVRFVRTVR